MRDVTCHAMMRVGPTCLLRGRGVAPHGTGVVTGEHVIVRCYRATTAQQHKGTINASVL